MSDYPTLLSLQAEIRALSERLDDLIETLKMAADGWDVSL